MKIKLIVCKNRCSLYFGVKVSKQSVEEITTELCAHVIMLSVMDYI